MTIEYMKKSSCSYFFFAVFIFFNLPTSFANEHLDSSLIVFTGDENMGYISNKAYFLEDKNSEYDISEILEKEFDQIHTQVLNFNVTPSSYWIKLNIYNISSTEDLIILVDNPLLTNTILYRPDSGKFIEDKISRNAPFHEQERYNPSPEFQVHQKIGDTVTYYLKVNSLTQLLIPIKVGKIETIAIDNVNKNLWHGIYFGIMMVMFFYNLFLYFSIKDKSYLYYIAYILSVIYVQLNTTGLGFKYIWSSFPYFEIYSTYISSALTAFASIAFIRKFLNTKQFAPRAHKFFWVFIIAYSFTILNVFIGNKYLSYNLLNINAFTLSLFMIGVATYIGRKYRYRPATFFLISWSIFLLGIIFFVLKDVGIVPYNLYSVSAVQIGSAIEVVLLSLALADKINILRRDKEESQRQTLAAIQENARIVREQNILLETKVTERTSELSKANLELSNALKELKEAEAQLVESEKMASLGQLTAGIAHEINNPINFVTSNVNPLKRNVGILTQLINQIEAICLMDIPVDEKKQKIEQLKQEEDYDYLCTEIEYLLNGIGEGATRTAEIVKGLRVFSRLDEDDLKLANIHDGLDSTLVILNHQLGNYIKINKKYSELPLVECYPGKLNQVFLNIMTNAIHAINLRWNKQIGGELTVATRSDDNNAYISIQDNGIGMDEATQKKIFEPFFTTKEVGEGTGLGMSIAYNTIKKHNGYIELASTPGVGTTFTLVIPLVHVISKEVNAETTA